MTGEENYDRNCLFGYVESMTISKITHRLPARVANPTRWHQIYTVVLCG
jgi:hypothetical protein